MVESDLETQSGENTDVNNSQPGNQGSGLRREPSFSGWCDEDGIIHLNYELQNVDEIVDDSDFELPSPQGMEEVPMMREFSGHSKSEHRSMQTNGNHTVDHVSARGKETYEPFDIENSSETERIFLNVGVDGPSYLETLKIAPPTSDSPINIVNVLKTLFFILVWYTFSTFLTLYNKTLLGDDMGKFPAPLLMNTVHFGMQAVLSKTITWIWSHRFQPSVRMSWRDYFMRVVPTALGTALDINLSNASLVSISVTFATMCKSAAPIFLLLFAFAFRLESPSFKLMGIILVISLGILLTVTKEAEFEFLGFILVMLAAVMSGFRWCMTQILLQVQRLAAVPLIYAICLKNPLTLMSYVTPVMTFITGLLSLLLDPWSEFRKNNYFNNSWHVTRSCLLMLFGGTLAFFMVLTEYILISVTSAVTVTIAGVVKEAVTILVAVLYFGDEFTWMKGVGLLTIMVGVGLFNWYKYDKLKKEQGGEEIQGSIDNVHARYVILDEMDNQDEAT
ncbi:Sugar phosphate transporter domain [Dillenia turbinata]|uniref:Sugar phosphate transporter domain n=1 Tax=Dillenia turbinata TaxID=194707 RepID=A0AAN8V1H7_9MAGN